MEAPTRVHDGAERGYAASLATDSLALTSVRDANVALLGLLATEADGARLAAFGVEPHIVTRVRGLDAAAALAVAACPYALFDIRFGDTAFWRDFALRRDPAAASASRTLADFARTAVFLAWHLAQSDDVAAALVLGMASDVQRLWRGFPVSALERAAAAGAPRLTVRWGRHPTFWPKLLDSSAPGARERAEAVRLLGLQLLAADGAWPPVAAGGDRAA